MAKKPTWLYRQSGVIPYRMADGKPEVLLVTSVRRGRWVIPKGVIERHLTAAESACKEAWEEAGVRGHVVGRSIGSYEYSKWGGTCSVAVFLMEVETEEDDWPERKERRRKWHSPKKAAKKVEEPELQELILAATAKLNGRR